MKRRDDIVAASEIAAWAWCPESWRLDSLELTTDDNGLVRDWGASYHVENAKYEKRSRLALSLGWWLLALAVLMGLLALGLGVDSW